LSEPKPQPRRRYWTPFHVLSLLAAFGICIVVFRYTGDSDPFFAIGSGMGFAAFAWVLNHLHWHYRNR
jgi:hypothetical protein